MMKKTYMLNTRKASYLWLSLLVLIVFAIGCGKGGKDSNPPASNAKETVGQMLTSKPWQTTSVVVTLGNGSKVTYTDPAGFSSLTLATLVFTPNFGDPNNGTVNYPNYANITYQLINGGLLTIGSTIVASIVTISDTQMLIETTTPVDPNGNKLPFNYSPDGKTTVQCTDIVQTMIH